MGKRVNLFEYVPRSRMGSCFQKIARPIKDKSTIDRQVPKGPKGLYGLGQPTTMQHLPKVLHLFADRASWMFRSGFSCKVRGTRDPRPDRGTQGKMANQ
jgi:hypothetical protein